MHWSVTFSDNDVYDNVMFNTQMKNDYLWLITG